MNPLLALAIILATPAEAASGVVAVTLDSVIHPITVDIVGHAIEQARTQHSDALLIRINTPGGLLEATRELNEKIISCPVPVIVYVTPSGGRAASAGFIILQTADIAAMAPGTNTGAASPILLGQQMDPVLRHKIENDASASLRSVTGKRGRNSALAEKAITEAKSFTDQEALENHLIDLVARDEADLFRQLEGKVIHRFDGKEQTLRLSGAQVVEYQLNIRERLIAAVSDPNLAFMLLIIGGLCVYVEFSHPGLILPGVVGGILVLVGLSALSVLPIHWAAVGLLFLALAFFVLEAKFTSHGVLGAGGVVAMVLGALMLVDGPPEMRIRLSTAIGVSVPFAVITILLMTLVIRARAAKVITGSAAMVGTIGVAYTPLNPAGKVHVRGEYWNATATAEVAEGAPVRVVGIDGLSLQVEPVSR